MIDRCSETVRQTTITLVYSFDDVVAALIAGASGHELESATLEFKSESQQLKRTLELIADAVVCFANSDGGMLVVGVDDKATGPGAIVGVSPSLDPLVVVKGVFDRTEPALSVPVFAHDVLGRTLLEITVPRGATFYSNAKGTATRRVGPECLPFPPSEQRQAMASRGLYDWSAEPSGVTRHSTEEMARIRRLLRAARRDDLAARSAEVILRDLRLAGDSGELTRAGLLLVGEPDDIVRELPTHGYSYQYRATPGAEATARWRESRTVLDGIERLIDSVETRRLVKPLNVAGGIQLTLEDYPRDAVRELVVNAFVHRDYEAAGAVDVEQSSESLRIMSPGGLVFGVTAENILSHPSTPRNRLLLETITALQVAERTGQGVDRAYRALLRSGKKPPTFVDSGTMVEVSVSGGTGNDAFTRFVNTGLPDALASDIEVLLVLDLLCATRTVDAAKVAPVIQQSLSAAQAALERMADAGIVEPSRRTATALFPKYSLTNASMTGLGLAVTYHRRGADGLDDKVIAHVREYGYITNQTIRRLFDVELFRARDMLQDLQRRGIVVKEDPAARGPGVRYAAGPRFPAGRGDSD